MAESVIERAARALCENPSEDPDEMIMMMNGEMWPRWRAEVWRVESVLNAIREPVESMLDAVSGRFTVEEHFIEADLIVGAGALWRAMIDEALK